MIRVYAGRRRTRPLGTAVQVLEPVLEGRTIDKIRNLREDGDELLFVVECDDQEHRRNIATGKVEELTREEAVRLAAEYHPKMSFRRRSSWLPLTKVVEERPALDLDKVLKKPKRGRTRTKKKEPTGSSGLERWYEGDV